jgi:hypothetical protein
MPYRVLGGGSAVDAKGALVWCGGSPRPQDREAIPKEDEMALPMRFMVEDEGINIYVPDWVVDLESFRRWSDDDDFPETGRISYLMGEVWVDMSKEHPFTHAEVKSEINTVLRTVVGTWESGWYWGDGPYVSNETADVSNQPDGVFVSKPRSRDHHSNSRATGTRKPGSCGSPDSSWSALKSTGLPPARWTVTVWS